MKTQARALSLLRRAAGAGLTCCLAALLACHGEPRPAGDLTGGPHQEPHRLFAHETHDPALDEQGWECEDCHVVLEDDLSEEVGRSGKESCHRCHVDGDARSAAGLRCVGCHAARMRAIVPENHRTGWVMNHGTQIETSGVACSECHSNRFCARCHTRRIPADRVFHRGSALVTHPLEARADPAQCQRCHHAGYCIRCHEKGRF